MRPFNIGPVIKAYHEFGNAVSVARMEAGDDRRDDENIKRMRMEFRRLALAMGYEVSPLPDEAEIIRPVFGKRRPTPMMPDDDRPGAA